MNMTKLSIAIFALCLFTGCESDGSSILDSFPETLGEIPVWRIQLAVKTCDLPDAEERRPVSVSIDTRRPGPLSTDSTGVFLYAPGETYRRGQIDIYDINIDDDGPALETIQDIQNIRIQPHSAAIDWCFDFIALYVNNPGEISFSDAEVYDESIKYQLFSKSWPSDSGYWIRGAQSFYLAAYNPFSERWQIFKKDFSGISTLIGTYPIADPASDDGFISILNEPRPSAFANAPNPPAGFEIYDATAIANPLDPNNPNNRQLAWYAFAYEANDVASFREVSRFYDSSRFEFPDAYNAWFNLPIRMSYPTFRSIIQGVMGHKIRDEAFDQARWGDQGIRTTRLDRDRLRIDVSLNRPGIISNFDLEFILGFSCNTAEQQIVFAIEDVNISLDRLSNVAAVLLPAFGPSFLAPLVEDEAEDQITNQLQDVTFDGVPCGFGAGYGVTEIRTL